MKSSKRAKMPKPCGKGYAPYSRASNKKTLIVTISLASILGSLALSWGILFVNGMVTLGGVPVSIVGKFLQDPTALICFLTGERAKLHQRLEEMGIESEIKAYYRPRIPDEVMLDQYIHQLLYDRTGYVGNNYLVTPTGNLVLKTSGEVRLRQEVQDLKRSTLVSP